MPPASTSTLRPRRGDGLYGLKPAFVARLHRVEDIAAARGIAPDAVTWAALGLAVVTAGALVAGTRYPLLWLAVGPLCLLRMGCNAIDGSLARRTQVTSRRGAVFNELGDRAADAVTFAALAPAVGVGLAIGVVTVALATSFVAVVALSTTGERLATGPMGKPDRVAGLSLAAAAAAFLGPVALVAGAWVLVLLGAGTIVRRSVVLWRCTGATS